MVENLVLYSLFALLVFDLFLALWNFYDMFLDHREKRKRLGLMENIGGSDENLKREIQELVFFIS